MQLLNENCRTCVETASQQAGEGQGDAACFLSAVVKTYQEVAHHCTERGPDCGLNSYVHIFLNNKSLKELGTKLSSQAAEQMQNSTEKYFSKHYIVPLVGCLAGGGLAAAAGAVRGVPGGPVGAKIGAAVAFPLGCRKGALIASEAYILYKGWSKLEKKLEYVVDVKNAVQSAFQDVQNHHHMCNNACIKRDIPPTTTISLEDFLRKPINMTPVKWDKGPELEVTFYDHSEPKEEEPIPRGPVTQDIKTGVFLDEISGQIMKFAGDVSGVKPALEELSAVRNLVQTIVTNPTDGPVKVVSHLLKRPEGVIRNVLQSPRAIVQNADHFIRDPAANYMGALAAVGSIMTFMNSVSWISDFGRDPKKCAKELVKTPYTCVKNVVNLGVGLIRHPEKTTIALFKSVVKAPETTVKRFLVSVGLKKKKRRKKHWAYHEEYVDPVHMAYLMNIKAETYMTNVMTLYFQARNAWLVDPYKSLMDYHTDLVEDFNSAVASGIYAEELSSFPQFLMARFEQKDLASIKLFSPRAHLAEPLPPPEVVIFMQIHQNLEKIENTYEDMEEAHKKHTQVIQELDVERQKLYCTTDELSALLDQNKDKIKQALKIKKGVL